MPTSIESLPEQLPFRTPDREIGTSQGTHVYGYDTNPLALKVSTVDEQSYETVNQAVTAAQDMKKVEAEVTNKLKREGVPEEAIPPSFPVIHKGPAGEINIARVQKRIKNSKPLSELGIHILSEPDNALHTLKGIMKANLRLWKEEKKLFDFVGSSPDTMQQKYIRRVVNHIVPVFQSRNIVSGEGNQIYFIDTINYNEPKIKDFHRWLGKNLFVVGTAISLGLINGVLKKRELSRKITNKRN